MPNNDDDDDDKVPNNMRNMAVNRYIKIITYVNKKVNASYSKMNLKH